MRVFGVVFALLVFFQGTAFGEYIHPDVEAAIKENERLKSSGLLKNTPDVSWVDGKQRFTGYRPTRSQYQGAKYRQFPVWQGRTAGEEIPKELDYTKIAPPNVVAQQCGDCWAQGAAMAFEGVIGWLDKASRNISRQSIIDCSDFGSCGGGYISVAFFEDPKGAVYTSDYPYRGRDQRCQTASLKYNEQARDTGFVRGEGSGRFKQADLQRALMEMGPLEVCGASSALSGGDSDGFLSSNRKGRVDHCWALYGWLDGETHGKTPGTYFIHVNSWGKDWGVGGIKYIRLASNGKDLEGSVVTEAAYIDYKDPVPPAPVTIVVESADVTLTAVVQPNSLYSVEEAKEHLEMALKSLGEQ